MTLHRIMVHMLAEISRHAGHADIVRELIDGGAGWRGPGDNMTPGERAWWEEYPARGWRMSRGAGEPPSHVAGVSLRCGIGGRVAPRPGAMLVRGAA